MFEYSNTGILVMGSMALVAVFFTMILASGKAKSEKRSMKRPYIGFLIMAFIVVFILLDSYTTKNTIDENIALFKEGRELQCSTLTTRYLVSKQRGWKLHGEAFMKDSLLLDAGFCEE